MNKVPKWRIVAAAAVLAALLFFMALFAPVYFRNQELQSFVGKIPQRVEAAANSGAAPADELVKTWVLDKAHDLDLPVGRDDIHILRAPGGGRLQRVEVHYMVKVEFPGYTVNLHFYPGAGSR